MANEDVNDRLGYALASRVLNPSPLTRGVDFEEHVSISGLADEVERTIDKSGSPAQLSAALHQFGG